MIKQWIEDRCVRWLASRGYHSIRVGVPYLIMTYATGTFHDVYDGTVYTIHMPKGHKRVALLNTVLVPDKPPPMPRKK
jgi:hypothetical protein